MTDSPPNLSPALAKLFLACAVMNLAGATLLAPPAATLRAEIGLPEAPAMYLWILAVWILIFGFGYLLIGLRRRFESTFLATAAAGKATFSLVLIATWLQGDLGAQAALSSLPDLLLALFFVALIRRRRSG